MQATVRICCHRRSEHWTQTRFQRGSNEVQRMAGPDGGLSYKTCLSMSNFHQHTCTWHLYLLERYNYSSYSLGDIPWQLQVCLCDWVTQRNTTTIYLYVCDTLIWWANSMYTCNWDLCFLEKNSHSLGDISYDNMQVCLCDRVTKGNKHNF